MKGPWSLKMLCGQHRVVKSGLTCCRNRNRGCVGGEGPALAKGQCIGWDLFSCRGKGVVGGHTGCVTVWRGRE